MKIALNGVLFFYVMYEQNVFIVESWVLIFYYYNII